jgi:formiminoglutamase
MLENWLRPVSQDFLKETDLKDFHFGKKIKIYRKKLPKMSEGQVALIGLDESAADAVRRELYLLSFAFKGTVITDLGNARRTEPDFLLQLLTDLYQSKIIPIFIGEAPSLALTQFKAHRLVQSAVNLAVVDEQIAYNTGDTTTSWLDYILDNSRSKLFHLSILGVQTHFLPPDIIQHLSDRRHDIIRAGHIRGNIQDTEPVLRDADTLVVNISALKASDAPAQAEASPSGLTSEEACQLARYAGMSEKLTAAGFYGFLPEKEQNRQTAKTVAQMIWYFLDGFHNRRNDYPTSTDNMVEYVTHIQGYDWQFTFWRSNKTGRWWLQVPIKTKKNLQRHRLLSCTYEDYTKAVNGELPERLLNAFERFA